MSDTPVLPDQNETDETVCYAHPKTPTKLRCSRCNRPICGRCAIPASVGQHCPECVAEARRSAPKVRTQLAATAPTVMAIIAINVIVFVAQNAVGGLTQRFAAIPPLIADGEYYRLITPMFLHSTDFLLHIVFNMFVLYIYGPNVEQAFGKIRFLVMYLICGFTGSVASYAFGPCFVSGVGASGAIFGLVGILIAYLYNRRSQTMMQAYMRNLLTFVGINMILGFVIAGIDWRAHVGGLVGGLVLGAGFDQGGKPNPSVGRQVATAAAVIAVGVAIVIWRTANFSCSFFPG